MTDLGKQIRTVVASPDLIPMPYRRVSTPTPTSAPRREEEDGQPSVPSVPEQVPVPVRQTRTRS